MALQALLFMRFFVVFFEVSFCSSSPFISLLVLLVRIVCQGRSQLSRGEVWVATWTGSIPGPHGSNQPPTLAPTDHLDLPASIK